MQIVGEFLLSPVQCVEILWMNTQLHISTLKYRAESKLKQLSWQLDGEKRVWCSEREYVMTLHLISSAQPDKSSFLSSWWEYHHSSLPWQPCNQNGCCYKNCSIFWNWWCVWAALWCPWPSCWVLQQTEQSSWGLHKVGSALPGFCWLSLIAHLSLSGSESVHHLALLSPTMNQSCVTHFTQEKHCEAKINTVTPTTADEEPKSHMDFLKFQHQVIYKWSVISFPSIHFQITAT